jgi:hypothetical protein
MGLLLSLFGVLLTIAAVWGIFLLVTNTAMAVVDNSKDMKEREKANLYLAKIRKWDNEHPAPVSVDTAKVWAEARRKGVNPAITTKKIAALNEAHRQSEEYKAWSASREAFITKLDNMERPR